MRYRVPETTISSALTYLSNDALVSNPTMPSILHSCTSSIHHHPNIIFAVEDRFVSAIRIPSLECTPVLNRRLDYRGPSCSIVLIYTTRLKVQYVITGRIMPPMIPSFFEVIFAVAHQPLNGQRTHCQHILKSKWQLM